MTITLSLVLTMVAVLAIVAAVWYVAFVATRPRTPFPFPIEHDDGGKDFR